jgi:hypothetical protein
VLVLHSDEAQPQPSVCANYVSRRLIMSFIPVDGIDEGQVDRAYSTHWQQGNAVIAEAHLNTPTGRPRPAWMNKKTKTPWPLVRERTIPTDRPPLLGEI